MTHLHKLSLLAARLEEVQSRVGADDNVQDGLYVT